MDGGREQARPRATNGYREALAAATSKRYETSGQGLSLHASPNQGAL